MLIGLSKLASFGRNFARAFWADMAYLLICLGRAVLLILKQITEGSVLHYVSAVLISLSALVLQFFILAGIFYISLQVELDKEAKAAKRNIGLIISYYILYVIVLLLAPYLGQAGNIAGLAVTVFGLAVIVLNGVLIHSCYCRICLKGQEHGERPPSKYAWVNRFNEKTDAMFDGAFLRQPKENKKKKSAENAEPEKTPEPGYLRVKRKKNKKGK